MLVGLKSVGFGITWCFSVMCGMEEWMVKSLHSIKQRCFPLSVYPYIGIPMLRYLKLRNGFCCGSTDNRSVIQEEGI